jgi:hypothetical protein
MHYHPLLAKNLQVYLANLIIAATAKRIIHRSQCKNVQTMETQGLAECLDRINEFLIKVQPT